MGIFTALADFIVFSLLQMTPDAHLTHAVHFFVEDVVKILCLLYLVAGIVSFFRSWLSPDKIRAALEGKPKFIAYFLAVLLGAITPFCSCSSIPLFIGFVEAGVPFGVAMAFLITSPMINEIALVVFAGVVGWKMALIYAGTGMLIGMLGGFMMERMGFEKYVKEMTDETRPHSKPLAHYENLWERFKDAFQRSWNIVCFVWLYVVIGVAVGAALHGFVPEEVFAKYAGADNIFAVPLAVLMGMPLYANTTGVIPVAEALLGKGVPLGTVLAMMMSVVALSMPEIVILRTVLRRRFLVYFVAFMGCAFIAVGYFYNALL